VLKRPERLVWRYARTALVVTAALAMLVLGGLTGQMRQAAADSVDCSRSSAWH
jgi:hypothetical protein